MSIWEKLYEHKHHALPFSSDSKDWSKLSNTNHLLFCVFCMLINRASLAQLLDFSLIPIHLHTWIYGYCLGFFPISVIKMWWQQQPEGERVYFSSNLCSGPLWWRTHSSGSLLPFHIDSWGKERDGGKLAFFSILYSPGFPAQRIIPPPQDKDNSLHLCPEIHLPGDSKFCQVNR